MLEAIALAEQWVETQKGGPFGAVVVRNGEIVGRGTNAVTTLNDPTAHAEVMAIRDACRHLKTFQLTDCEIYSSCEPCPMCLGAIYWARPKVLYFSTDRHDAAKAGFDDSFIYDELNIALVDRKIPTEQHRVKEADDVFLKWMHWNHRIEY